ncbi:MAG: hypothetical protein JJ896_10070 [Rhodothermales bacterium]|nr:hypothetical protein [Rhodothermales bacterium]MBO6779986.1 hypothetical protein [Rhodothermales bacterium]
MVSLTALWLPILVATVLVFLASWIMHTVLPLHHNDFDKLPNEESFLADSRAAGWRPGQYAFPRPDDPKDWMNEEFQAKANQGPMGIVFVGPGMDGMGKQLGQHFAYCLFISVFAAYIGAETLAAGTEYMQVFQVTGAVAFAAYGLAHVSHAIWWMHSWSSTGKYLLDALVYGLLTAGAFGWLWPGA